jgi:hypothetical protein
VILEFDRGEVTVEPGDRLSYRFRFIVYDEANALASVVTVVDDDVPPPRAFERSWRSGALECRTDGLWFACICETPDEHWSFGLEAFGLAYATEAEADIGGYGDRLPVGYDLEWERTGTDGVGEVHGQVLIGREVIVVEGRGRFAP